MGVPEPTTPLAGLSPLPPIPERGLEEVLRSWSGSGQLWAALAACKDPIAERSWDAVDVRARAHRILFSQLAPLIARWPRDLGRWMEALPPELVRSRVHAERPHSGMDWRATRRLGWPPAEFVSRPPRRRNDNLLAQVLIWTLRRLLLVSADAATPATDQERLAYDRATAAFGLLAEASLAGLDTSRPGFADLRGVRAVGQPWTDLALVAKRLLLLDSELERLAWEVVAPDPDLAWRLFHLGVLGEVLHSLRTSGARVTSLRPLGASVPGPAFAVLDSDEEAWDLWFEAGGIWRYYECQEPYQEVSRGVLGAGSALGCDVMLVQPSRRALLIECKYSQSGSVVARAGYLQALAYATEANELCPAVTSAVVGPSDVVTAPGWTTTLSGLVGMLNPDDIPLLIEHCMRAE